MGGACVGVGVALLLAEASEALLGAFVAESDGEVGAFGGGGEEDWTAFVEEAGGEDVLGDDG